MSKYSPLADYLRHLPGSSVQLTFSQVDALIDGLPPSARNHDAWWANSRSADSHTWAHLWIDAGWECGSIDRGNETVVFRRTLPHGRGSALRYWWVNHKQTFKAEFEGGYIWSPKANKNGDRKLTYDNLTQVQRGDVVVSYAGLQIKAVGVALGSCTESPKPKEFGHSGLNWSEDGWLVTIEWTALPRPISPKANIDRIRPLLPEKNSPLQANGNGNQSCYLADISSELGQAILDIASQSNPHAIQAIKDLEQQVEADSEEQAILSAGDIPETEKEQLVRSRRGQGLFRQRVLAIEPRCRLTGVSDQNFLIASHIKPWKDCVNEERLDGHNGLMLAPHVDRLFDRGWISFDDRGRMLVAAQVLPILDAWKIEADVSSGAFRDVQKAYMEYHREVVFKGRANIAKMPYQREKDQK